MTLKQEHILFFAFAVLAILLLWDLRNKALVTADAPAPEQSLVDPFASNVATPANSAEGASYLTYNQPYAFAPPTQMTLHETTQGQIGQSSVTILAPDCTRGC